MTAVVEFQDVVRSYGRRAPALTGVSFSVGPGEVVGLLGRNGAGKTTLLRIAMGMLWPDGGSARVFGVAPTDDPVAVKKRIGYAAEDQILPRGATVAELIALHRFLFPQWDESMERTLLDRFALPPRAKIGTLSKGQARQAALICALCHRPELLILDEPAGGLDPAVRREFLEAAIQLLNREGTTMLFSSHHMTDVERIGSRVVLLDGGKVRLDRPLDALRETTSVVVVPRRAAPEVSMIERIPGCLGVRAVYDDWHAVFEAPPEGARLALTAALGADGFACARVPLEDLFVELVGGEREGTHT